MKPISTRSYFRYLPTDNPNITGTNAVNYRLMPIWSPRSHLMNLRLMNWPLISWFPVWIYVALTRRFWHRDNTSPCADTLDNLGNMINRQLPTPTSYSCPTRQGSWFKWLCFLDLEKKLGFFYRAIFLN